jgi:hypothetical protein
VYYHPREETGSPADRAITKGEESMDTKKATRLFCLVAFMMLLGVSALQPVSKAAARHQEQQWSIRNKGFIKLMQELSGDYRNGRISVQEASKIFILSLRSGLSDDRIGELAAQYSKTREYAALRQTLEQAARDSGLLAAGPGSEYCRAIAGAVEYGCLMGGGEYWSCLNLADTTYCECMGGTTGGSGGCLIM